jgi:uncharacterized iron-regulated protein
MNSARIGACFEESSMVDDTVASLMAIGFTALLLSALTSIGWLQAPIDLRSEAQATRGWITSNVAPNGVGSASLDITLAPPKLPQIPVSDTTTLAMDPGTAPGTTKSQPATSPTANRAAKLGLQHPLLDMIYAPDRQEAIAPATLARELAAADIVLIGETHDNPDHHNLQAWIIRELLRKGRKPTIAMEMIGADQQPQLANYLGRQGATPEGLGDALGWNKHWPDWNIYLPIARAAFDNKLPIVPADADADRIDQVGRSGLNSLVDTERQRLGLTAALSSADTAALLSEIKQAHCGLLPGGDIEPMSQVQRFRDAAIADNLLTAAAKSSGGVVLIAGAGHVRTDRAVPFYLRQRGPQYRTLSVMLMEVDDAVRDPAAAVPRDSAGRAAADFIWYTARAERVDQCEEMRKALARRNGNG